MTTLNTTQVPAPRVPMLDPRSGLVSREWYMFFLNLFNLTGGGSSEMTVLDLQLLPHTDSQAGAALQKAKNNTVLLWLSTQ